MIGANTVGAHAEAPWRRAAYQHGRLDARFQLADRRLGSPKPCRAMPRHAGGRRYSDVR